MFNKKRAGTQDGKSELSIQIGDFYFGRENKTYESFDGDERYRSSGGTDAGIAFEQEFGVFFWTL